MTYFSETAGRKSITQWLYSSLEANLPYDQFVTKLLNPVETTDPEGFLIGVNWRGETSAAVKPWMQASQNTAQIFLGVNLKCNSCHDSFVSKWKLKDAYSLAAYFAPEPKLQLYRCDVAQERYAEPGFLFPNCPVPPRLTRWLIVAPPQRRSSPTRASDGSRGRWSTASGRAFSATESSATRMRWTGSRGALSCSIGSRAISCSTTST